MRKWSSGVAALLLLCACVNASDVTITKPGGAGKASLDLSQLRAGGGAPAQFLKTLESDLERSGWFLISKPGQGGIIVQGACQESGASLVAQCDVRNIGSAESYLNKAFQSERSKPRRLAHEVADAIVYAVKGVPGIASTRIAMIGSRSGGKDLYVCDYDGQGLVQITREGKPCLGPGWSPDASTLVYMSFSRNYPDVYKIDLQSMRRTQIAAYPGLNAGATVAPDGRTVALTLSKDGNPELYLTDLGGGRLTRLTRTERAAEASPAWSPDGSQIVYVSDQSGSPQLYVISRSGGQGKRLSFRGSENVAPDWSREGQIVCSSRQGGRYQLCLIDPSSGAPELLTTDGVDHEDPTWAPDSRHIVYTRTAGYKKDVYVLDTLKDPEIRLTTVAGDWYSPAWSPK